MRKITELASNAFWNNSTFSRDNTVVGFNRDNEIVVVLWSTAVCRINHKNELVLNSGGYRTRTTQERINGVLSRLGMRIQSVKGSWRVFDNRGDSMPFEDGMRIKL